MSGFPYQIAIGASSGMTPEQVVTVFNDWRLDKNLDDGCSLSISMPGNSLPGVLMSELDTDVWMYLDGTLIERLRIVAIEQTWGPHGENSLSVTAACYRRLLAGRHTMNSLVIGPSTLGAIAQQLIVHTQTQTNGNLQITYGTNTTTETTQRDYVPGSNILELITNLAATGIGMAWSIDENLVYSAKNANDFTTAPQPVELGNNALSLTKPSGAQQFANVVIATGDTSQTTAYQATSPTLPTDTRGRWERYASFPSETVQGNVNSQAEGLLRDTLSPQIQYRFELERGRYLTDSNYDLGQFITIVEPPQTVPSASNSSIPLLTIPGTAVTAQVTAQTLTVTAAGDLTIVMTAVRTYPE